MIYEAQCKSIIRTTNDYRYHYKLLTQINYDKRLVL